ncbi:hypothetical protein C4K03_4407 [Pseudomonas synxantha]|uniref:Uncharacterized protein n=1 Tax=Pseudomonas synxantha TaxID=47883 RepID=A0A3G7UB26_9PSED|nr:hypothetical protein C4K03_4407 [Pseudomonas synxantha]
MGIPDQRLAYSPSNSAIKSLNRSTFSALISLPANPSIYSANSATVLHSQKRGLTPPSVSIQ